MVAHVRRKERKKRSEAFTGGIVFRYVQNPMKIPIPKESKRKKIVCLLGHIIFFYKLRAGATARESGEDSPRERR